jgi:hypothetical protein
MPVEKVQLGVSAIKELLDNGYTWLKKDDLGFGSIQEKYQASDVQVSAIRKHPLLKDLETTARIFVIVDDTKDHGTTLHTKEPVHTGSTEDNAGRSNVSVGSQTANLETVSENDDSFSAFANL